MGDRKFFKRPCNNILPFGRTPSTRSSIPGTPLQRMKVCNEKRYRPIDFKPIHIRYDRDYDILHFHTLMLDDLKNQRENIISSPLYERLKELQEIIKKPQTILQRNGTITEIEEIRKNIGDIASGKRIDDYLKRTGNAIERYKSIGNKVRVIDISTVNSGTPEKYQYVSEEDATRMSAIEEYFDVVKDFININVARYVTNHKLSCHTCGTDISKLYIDEYSRRICPNCGTERYSSNLCGHKGIDNGSSNREYDAEATFKKELMYFQGKQKVYIEPTVYDELDTYFTRKGFPPGKDIKKWEVNKFGKSVDGNGRTASLQALLEGLEAAGHSELYKHANYIGREYWGWVLHDLSAYEQSITDKYRRTQQAYYRIPRKRRSNIPSQYRIYRQLLLEGITVDKNDFKLGTTDGSKTECEVLWQKMVAMAGLGNFKRLY